MSRYHKNLSLFGASLTLLSLGATEKAQTQVLSLASPRLSGRTNDILTFSLVVDGGVGTAVAWGTDISFANNTVMVGNFTLPVLAFVPDFGGTNQPFKSTQPFFDTDLSDQSDFANGNLHLYFANFTPGAILGTNDKVTLGQFQVQIQNTPGPCDTDPTVDCNAADIVLSPLGIPPDGSAVQDEDGNNLLQGISGARVTKRPPSPEPAGWLTMLAGTGIGLLALRRKSNKS